MAKGSKTPSLSATTDMNHGRKKMAAMSEAMGKMKGSKKKKRMKVKF